MVTPADVGCVAIGRNEEARLGRGLASLVATDAPFVYVDSGSTDRSVAIARELGVPVVSLDPSVPFSAARARNEGLAHLLAAHPHLAFVQFVDGDCELDPRWLEIARARFEERPALAVACGRRRERDLDASVWHRVLDVEWDTPVGDARACGGDAMVRLRALTEVGGFDPALIAGEEPELCARIRDAGWSVERLDAPMTTHDAALTRAAQWWRRTVRSGHACAEAARRAPLRNEAQHDLARIVAWGAVLPALATVLALPTAGASLGLFAAYPLNAARIYRRVRRRGRSRLDAAAYATAISVSKFAELEGVVQALRARRRRRPRTLIEYR